MARRAGLTWRSTDALDDLEPGGRVYRLGCDFTHLELKSDPFELRRHLPTDHRAPHRPFMVFVPGRFVMFTGDLVESLGGLLDFGEQLIGQAQRLFSSPGRRDALATVGYEKLSNIDPLRHIHFA